MALLLLLAMLTACAATPEDLSGKMFSFPNESNNAHVRLIQSRQNFSALTVCLRFFTGLSRGYSLFSMASKSTYNELLIFKEQREHSSDEIHVKIKDRIVVFGRQDFTLNTWHSICSTWDSESELADLWLDGKASNGRPVIVGAFVIILGQEQDSYGGGFQAHQSFVGNISDVHMWDYPLSPCEIRGYMNHQDFPPGNVLNWRALEFQIDGNVKIQSIYNPSKTFLN